MGLIRNFLYKFIIIVYSAQRLTNQRENIGYKKNRDNHSPIEWASSFKDPRITLCLRSNLVEVSVIQKGVRQDWRNRVHRWQTSSSDLARVARVFIGIFWSGWMKPISRYTCYQDEHYDTHRLQGQSYKEGLGIGLWVHQIYDRGHKEIEGSGLPTLHKSNLGDW